MSLDDAYYLRYPEDEDSFFLDEGECTVTSFIAPILLPSQNLNVVHLLRKKEIGELVQSAMRHINLQPALLSKIVQRRWSLANDKHKFLEDCSLLLQRKLARWEGRALLFLISNSLKKKRSRRELLFEPLPRWVAPVENFPALLDRLVLCKVDLRQRNYYDDDFLTDLLKQSKNMISQEEIKSLLTYLLPRRFRCSFRGIHYLLCCFCERIVKPEFHETFTDTTVDVIRLIVESFQGRGVSNEFAESSGGSRKIMPLGDGFFTFITGGETNVLSLLFLNNCNNKKYALEIAHLLIYSGFSDEADIVEFFRLEPLAICLSSRESLEKIMELSNFLQQYLSESEKKKLSATSNFWRFLKAYYDPPREHATLLSFVVCVLEVVTSSLAKRREIISYHSINVEDIFLELCSNCEDKSLPEILKIFLANDKNILRQKDLMNAALICLSENRFISEETLHNTLRRLIELGVKMNRFKDNRIVALRISYEMKCFSTKLE